MLTVKLCAFADEASPNLLEQIEELNKNAVPYIEIRGVNGKNIFDATLDEAKEWKNQLDNGGIKVWSVGSPIGKVNLDTDWQEYLKKCKNLFEVAKILNANRVRIFSFFTSEYEKDATLVVERLNELCNLASEYGILLCHENEKEIFGDIALRCDYLLNSVPKLTCVFDPANFVQCGQEVDGVLDLLKGRIEYYHIKDAKRNGAIVPAGKGDGALDKVVDSICKDTVLTVEPHLTVFEGYSGLDKTEMLHEFVYSDSKTAFKVAIDSIKEILKNKGYSEENRVWKK